MESSLGEDKGGATNTIGEVLMDKHEVDEVMSPETASRKEPGIRL